MSPKTSKARQYAYAPPPRPAAVDWPRWLAALDALQAQARFGTAMLPGNPFNMSVPHKNDVAAVRAVLAAYQPEARAIAGMVMSGHFDTEEEVMTIPDLTPERLRAAWSS